MGPRRHTGPSRPVPTRRAAPRHQCGSRAVFRRYRPPRPRDPPGGLAMPTIGRPPRYRPGSSPIGGRPHWPGRTQNTNRPDTIFVVATLPRAPPTSLAASPADPTRSGQPGGSNRLMSNHPVSSSILCPVATPARRPTVETGLAISNPSSPVFPHRASVSERTRLGWRVGEGERSEQLRSRLSGERSEQWHRGPPALRE